MSVDLATVKRVAHLARIAVTEDEAMTSVTPMAMKKRTDEVTDGSKADDIVANAPLTDQNFFLVPKVVE
jgi:aspartyl-tRNA(Asn)/glutamyl-tRNA(Gln) amidotransferase subunit C